MQAWPAPEGPRRPAHSRHVRQSLRKGNAIATRTEDMQQRRLHQPRLRRSRPMRGTPAAGMVRSAHRIIESDRPPRLEPRQGRGVATRRPSLHRRIVRLLRGRRPGRPRGPGRRRRQQREVQPAHRVQCLPSKADCAQRLSCRRRPGRTATTGGQADTTAGVATHHLRKLGRRPAPGTNPSRRPREAGLDQHFPIRHRTAHAKNRSCF